MVCGSQAENNQLTLGDLGLIKNAPKPLEKYQSYLD
jgi:hypothetical protein